MTNKISETSWDELRRKAEEEYQKVLETNRKIGKGIRAGKIFQVSVADGYAYYKITKKTKQFCTVEWIDNEWLNPDDWIHSIFSEECVISSSNLAHIMKQMDGRGEIFGKKK